MKSNYGNVDETVKFLRYIQSINNLFNSASLDGRKRLEGTRGELDDYFKGKGYTYIGSCNECVECSPREVSLIFDGDCEEFRKITEENTRIENKRLLRKLLREFATGGLTCHHYADSRWLKSRRNKGVIVSQEYSLSFIPTREKMKLLISDSSKVPKEQLTDFLLRNTSFHFYERTDGSYDEGMFNERCKKALGVPENVTIEGKNLPEMTN